MANLGCALSRPGGPAATVEAYAAALGRGDLSAVLELVAPDVVGHEPAGRIGGSKAFERNLADWLDSLPDMRLVTDDLFEAGDRAAWRWTVAGTHAGSGRSITVSGVILFRVSEGRVVEYWGHYDRLGVQQQLSGP